MPQLYSCKMTAGNGWPAAAVLVGFSVFLMCINAFALERFDFRQW